MLDNKIKILLSKLNGHEKEIKKLEQRIIILERQIQLETNNLIYRINYLEDQLSKLIEK